MREFTVTARGSVDSDLSGESITGDFVFIASESPTPLPWSSVVSNPARRERKFSGTAREIYFSLTDAYASPIVGRREIDLATGSDAAARKALVDSIAPGIMSPNTNYYVHAYKTDGSQLGSSSAIRTIDYPASYPSPTTSNRLVDFLWNMDMWKKGTDLQAIEARPGEPIFVPLRYIIPNTPCYPNLNILEEIRVGAVVNTMIQANIKPYSSPFLVNIPLYDFTNSPAGSSDDYIDYMMGLTRDNNPDSSWPIINGWLAAASGCLSNNPTNLSQRITIVGE